MLEWDCLFGVGSKRVQLKSSEDQGEGEGDCSVARLSVNSFVTIKWTQGLFHRATRDDKTVLFLCPPPDGGKLSL